MARAISSVAGSMRFTTSLLEALGITGQQETSSPSQPLAWSLSVGSGADQCSKFATYVGSVTSGAPTSHDLAGGSLIDVCTSAAVTFTRLVGVLVINYSTSTYLTFGGGSNPVAAYTNSLPIGPSTSLNPGAHLNIRPDATGMVVTPATGDILKVDCGSGSADYKLFLWGS